jgi:hypothetical protein
VKHSKAKSKKKRTIRFRVSERLYKQFIQESKRFEGDRLKMMQFLVKRYLSKDGVDGDGVDGVE